jgi:hypothetical protein
MKRRSLVIVVVRVVRDCLEIERIRGEKKRNKKCSARYACAAITTIIEPELSVFLLLLSSAPIPPVKKNMFTRFKLSFEQFVVRRLVGRRVVNLDPRKIHTEYTPTSEQEKVDHSLWTEVLKRCVAIGKERDGLVDTNLFNYKLVMGDAELQGKMNQYLDQISNLKLDLLNDNERVCVLINLYNALAIKTILDAMKEGKSLVSITDLSTARQSVWKRPAFMLNGREVALDNIEHDFLRREWNEPRVHACVVCASMRYDYFFFFFFIPLSSLLPL